MNPPPITEEDLHAFVDGLLTPERRAEVSTWLHAHPEQAVRIAGWKADRLRVRQSLAAVAQEPLPPRLHLRRLAATSHPSSALPFWRSWQWGRPDWAIPAAAALLLLVGASSGWVLRGYNAGAPSPLFALGQEAAASYSVYAPDRLRPVEIRADEQDQLTAWARERTGSPLAIPELSAAGYRFMGGRVVAGAQGAAVLLMYDDDRGTRLVMLARPMKNAPNSTMAAVAQGGVRGFVWSEKGVGYSLVGEAATDTLHPLANEIRQQIRENA